MAASNRYLGGRPINDPTDRLSANIAAGPSGNTPPDFQAGRLVVGISGASGIVYGVRLLEVLRDSGVETHLILSQAAARIAQAETGWSAERIASLAAFVHSNDDLSAPVSSGSYPTLGMVVAPCSIKSLSAIAHSYNDTLLARAADVTLKEGRKLVLVVRETPLHLGHLRLMAQAAEYGAVVLPPMPAFYHRPQTIADLVDQTVGKILDQFGLEHSLFRRWQGGCGLGDDTAE